MFSNKDLKNSFNTIFIFLFTALASGGAVISNMINVVGNVIGVFILHAGAGDDRQAAYYFHKLLKITLLFSAVWNTAVFALTPVIMPFFNVAPETRSLTVWLFFFILFAVILEMGVVGIAVAMCLDWCIRAVVFYIRFRSGKWKQFQLI